MKNETYTIINPDHVELKFQLAGIGSRLFAGVLDLIFLSLTNFIIILILLPFIVFDTLIINTVESGPYISKMLFILIFFFTYWGYHVFWESISNGQSPGKKCCGIQVIDSSGKLPTWKQSAIRNLLRIVDSFPLLSYTLAGLSMGIDPHGRRLGDITAGTLVVRTYERSTKKNQALSARAMTQAEKGKKQQALTLRFGSVDVKTLALIRRFLMRRKQLSKNKRKELALKIAAPLYNKWGEEAEDPERFLEMIEKLSEEESKKAVNEERTKEKLRLWNKFEKTAQNLVGKKRLLKKLAPEKIDALINMYRNIVADLARARSSKTDHETIQYLNSLAILGHQLLYPNLGEKKAHQPSFFFRFPMTVREYVAPFMLATVLFFVPAVIAYVAVINHPEIGYELVPDQFLDFKPAQNDNIHAIPSITRPVAASEIMTNNIQVTFLAFALGVTAGLGTCMVLIYNGVHLGSIAAWMQLHGNAYALWGWIMPHGGTEILAIILSGTAGFILGNALLRPGALSWKDSLKQAAKPALTIELGCIIMLIVAGIIEGFISPSSMPYLWRIVFSLSLLGLWGIYFSFGGNRHTVKKQILK